MKYIVILERGERGWGAHVPDLPGCIAAADTREKVLQLIREAIDFHIEGMRQNGESVPDPHSESTVVEVVAACSETAS